MYIVLGKGYLYYFIKNMIANVFEALILLKGQTLNFPFQRECTARTRKIETEVRGMASTMTATGVGIKKPSSWVGSLTRIWSVIVILLCTFGDNELSIVVKAQSLQPSDVPSDLPSLIPSEAPTETLSSAPTPTSSNAPTSPPSVTPSLAPSVSVVPTEEPSQPPTVAPTVSSEPSTGPSQLPSDAPSLMPSDMPTQSALPSSIPSRVPTNTPTYSANPSGSPSISSEPSVSDSPSRTPTTIPTISTAPSFRPTITPSTLPTGYPSAEPSGEPSSFPTIPLQEVRQDSIVMTVVGATRMITELSEVRAWNTLMSNFVQQTWNTLPNSPVYVGDPVTRISNQTIIAPDSEEDSPRLVIYYVQQLTYGLYDDTSAITIYGTMPGAIFTVPFELNQFEFTKEFSGILGSEYPIFVESVRLSNSEEDTPAEGTSNSNAPIAIIVVVIAVGLLALGTGTCYVYHRYRKDANQAVVPQNMLYEQEDLLLRNDGAPFIVDTEKLEPAQDTRVSSSLPPRPLRDFSKDSSIPSSDQSNDNKPVHSGSDSNMFVNPLSPIGVIGNPDDGDDRYNTTSSPSRVASNNNLLDLQDDDDDEEDDDGDLPPQILGDFQMQVEELDD